MKTLYCGFAVVVIEIETCGQEYLTPKTLVLTSSSLRMADKGTNSASNC